MNPYAEPSAGSPLIRFRGAASSRSLRPALPVMALLAVTQAVHAQQNRSPDPWQRMAREVLAELVGINTTHSAGSTTVAAEAMRRRLLDAGFPPADVVVVEHVAKKGNLVARLRGRSPDRKPILLLAHLDVVEADPADWTLPPFELIEKDGTFYGRGTADDKDEAAIHITNLVRMKTVYFDGPSGEDIRLEDIPAAGPQRRRRVGAAEGEESRGAARPDGAGRRRRDQRADEIGRQTERFGRGVGDVEQR